MKGCVEALESQVDMKDAAGGPVPLAPYGQNIFYLEGGSLFGDRMTFESNQDGATALKWRNYTFKRQP